MLYLYGGQVFFFNAYRTFLQSPLEGATPWNPPLTLTLTLTLTLKPAASRAAAARRVRCNGVLTWACGWQGPAGQPLGDAWRLSGPGGIATTLLQACP